MEMQDIDYGESPALGEKVLRYDVIVPNVWDWATSQYGSTIDSHESRIAGWAKESRIEEIENEFAPSKVHWRTQKEYWYDYDNKQNAWK